MESNQRESLCLSCTCSLRVRRQLSALIMIAVIMMCILTDIAQTCYSRNYFNYRRRSNEHPFIREEHQPRSRESDFMASGPLYYSDLVYKPKTLDRLHIGPNSGIVAVSRNATRMTEACKNRVMELGLLVHRTWGGRVRLRIRKGWRPPHKRHKRMGKKKRLIRYSQHSSRRAMEQRQEDYHSAGRAVDFDLILPPNPIDTMNLGKLAELAYYKAKFNWCRYDLHSIHCSVKAGPIGGGSTFECFPGSSIVRTEMDGPKPLSKLQIGDRVLSVDTTNGELMYSKVEMFLHREPQTVTTFLHFETSGNSSFSLSANHLIYRLRGAAWQSFPSSVESVYAQTIRPGDRILMTTDLSSQKSVLRPVTVLSRRLVTRRGIVAPLTSTGNIVVDDHLMSCFAHVSYERLARWAFLPYQVLHRWWEDWSNRLTLVDSPASATDSTEGVHWYAMRLFTFASTFLPKSWLFPD